MFQYEDSRTFEYALAESKGLIVQSLDLSGGLQKIHFFEGVRGQVGPYEMQSFYWRAVLNDGTVRRGEIRLDYSRYRVEFFDGWEMSDSDMEAVPGWAFR